MAGGRLRCVGSSLHLKQKYGAGYSVTIGTKSQEKIPALCSFVQTYFGESARVISSVGNFATFAIPRDQSQQLVPFFKLMTEKSEELSIDDTQLSITTLEEVFLR